MLHLLKRIYSINKEYYVHCTLFSSIIIIEPKNMGVINNLLLN